MTKLNRAATALWSGAFLRLSYKSILENRMLLHHLITHRVRVCVIYMGTTKRVGNINFLDMV